MARAKHVVNGDGAHYGLRFHCPGCDEEHVITTKPHAEPAWDFNGDYGRPTVSPSILVHEVRIPADADPAKILPPYKPGDIYTPRCHSFVTDGRIQFLSDCGHKLAGQTVDLPEIE